MSFHQKSSIRVYKQVIIELEEEFGIEVPDAEAEKIQSVADAIECEFVPCTFLLLIFRPFISDLASHPKLMQKQQ